MPYCFGILRLAIPLYVFYSGFFAERILSLSFSKLIKNLFFRQFLPALTFAILTLFLSLLFDNQDVSCALKSVFFSGSGIHEHLFQTPAHFLYLLFFLNVLYYVIHLFTLHFFNLPRYRWLCIFALSFLIAMVGFYARLKFPEVEIFGKRGWSLPFSFDLAMLLLPYYAVGSYFFPSLSTFRFSDLSPVRKILYGSFGCICITYVICALHSPAIAAFCAPHITHSLPLDCVYVLVNSIPFIVCVISLLLLLNRDCILARIGQYYLFLLCCNSIVHLIFLKITKLLGLSFRTETVWDSFIVGIIELLFAYCVIVSICKKLFPPFAKNKPVKTVE